MPVMRYEGKKSEKILIFYKIFFLKPLTLLSRCDIIKHVKVGLYYSSTFGLFKERNKIAFHGKKSKFRN